eukprot:Seg2045.2 transcript_id=Seg2045.2/GoldUCD/mRNA.D3Y31 product="MAP kinase kinase kinase wis4" protein_id=Seg2045.2/GoldUCD/D3Y31
MTLHTLSLERPSQQFTAMSTSTTNSKYHRHSKETQKIKQLKRRKRRREESRTTLGTSSSLEKEDNDNGNATQQTSATRKESDSSSSSISSAADVDPHELGSICTPLVEKAGINCYPSFMSGKNEMARKIVSLEHEREELNTRLARKEQKIQVLETRNHMLREKCSAMHLRDAEFTFHSVKDKVNPRSVMLVDSAIFGDLTHESDPLIQESVVSVLNSSTFEDEVTHVSSIKGKFSSVQIVRFKDGTPAVLKRSTMWNKEQSDVRNLQFIGHEARLLKYIGNHENIISPYGIVYWQTSFYVVLSYAGSLPLSKMLQSYPINSGHDLQIIVNGIANGLAHLHSMSVLHNHLVCDNVSLVAGGDAHRPMLIGFSFACRLEVAKIFSPKVIERLQESGQIAPEVATRRSKPSVSSDVYSFGKIVKKIMARKLPLSEYPLQKLHSLQKMCLTLDPAKRPKHGQFLEEVDICFFDMYDSDK